MIAIDGHVYNNPDHNPCTQLSAVMNDSEICWACYPHHPGLGRFCCSYSDLSQIDGCLLVGCLIARRQIIRNIPAKQLCRHTTLFRSSLVTRATLGSSPADSSISLTEVKVWQLWLTKPLPVVPYLYGACRHWSLYELYLCRAWLACTVQLDSHHYCWHLCNL